MIVPVFVTGCLSARIGPERVRKENPKFYKQWVEQLRRNGLSDDDLKKMGFKEPILPTNAPQ
jgi:hypothetical protein